MSVHSWSEHAFPTSRLLRLDNSADNPLLADPLDCPLTDTSSTSDELGFKPSFPQFDNDFPQLNIHGFVRNYFQSKVRHRKSTLGVSKIYIPW